MKKIRKMISIALALVMCLCAAIPAFAAEYESSHASYSVDGHTYDLWSSLYTRSPNTGAAWICESNYTNMPAKYLGAKARVYDENNQLLKQTDMNYTTSASYYMVASVDVSSTGKIYSKGEAAVYNGVDYDTLPCPKTEVVTGGIRSYAYFSEEAVQAAATYGVNDKGETYGSSMFSEVNGCNPDLISAVGNHGLSGYVRDDELNLRVSTPKEAKAFQENMPSTRTIPLYDLDGNVIDSFTVDNTNPLAEEMEQELSVMQEEHRQMVEAAIRSRNGEYVPVVGCTADGEPVEGYSGQRDLDGPEVHNPEEAEIYMKNFAGMGYSVPVYDIQGNVIGLFTVEGAKGLDALSQQELPAWLKEDKM